MISLYPRASTRITLASEALLLIKSDLHNGHLLLVLRELRREGLMEMLLSRHDLQK